MAVPKKRTSKARKRQRRSHLALSAPGLSRCSQCGASRSPHRVCAECGHYNGRQVIAVEREDDL